MGRRDLLTGEERRLLFGVPADRDALVRFYTLDRADLDLVAARRGDTNRLGFAVQLALLRHPGFGYSPAEAVAPELLEYVAGQLGIAAEAFGDYGVRVPTVTEHARELERVLGVRPPGEADMPFMIEAAARAAWPTDKGLPIAEGVVTELRRAGITLPPPHRIERAGLAGRARARKRAADALLSGLSADGHARLDALLAVAPETGRAPLTWLKDLPLSPNADNVREILEKLAVVRSLALDPAAESRVHPDRLRLLAREGRLAPAYAIERYTPARRRSILVALLLDLECRLTDAALAMADKLIGESFARARNAQERTYAATGRDVARLMRLLHGTAAAVDGALRDGADIAAAIDRAVGLHELAQAAPEAGAIAALADEDPLVRAADKWATLRKYGPLLLEAIDFRAGRADDQTIAAVHALRDLNRSGRREVPKGAPMPFKKEWRRLVVAADGRIDRRMYETALFAHARNRWRSGDVWVERSTAYRRFDSYLLGPAEAAPIAAELGLPATADEWLSAKARALDWRLRRLAHGLSRGELDGVALRGAKLSIAPVRADEVPEADALAQRIGSLVPRVRVTELLHEVAAATGFLAEFTNFRTQRPADNESAILAAILADATNLGLSRMADASQGLTREQLFWARDAHVREETYKAALARVIDAHHELPIAALWGDGTASSSDGQFFRSGKRGDGAGEVNARYGVEPGFSFYSHTSGRYSPYASTTISAAEHEAPYVLDGLLRHGSSIAVSEHYTDTGGATDTIHFLCEALGIRFCPRLRDFPDRRLASIEPASRYPGLKPLLGNRVKVGLIREHWGDIVRLVASLKAGAVLPSAMLKKLSAYERQNQLDAALREAGRLVRTEFMIDWFETPALRRRCHAGLNKSEQRNALTGQVYTYKQGRVADRDLEAKNYRASGLNLVIAAIVYWNSTYMADAVAHLRAAGEAVPDHLLARTSPVAWEHIAFSGDFLWDRAAVPLAGRRPLNLPRQQRAA